jgi:hypothetical protein
VARRGLKCLRESSSFVGRNNGSRLDCWYSVAPTGLEICFLAFPRIASKPGAAGSDFILGYYLSLPTGGFAAARSYPGPLSLAPYGRFCRCAVVSWSVVSRSLREVLPLRGLKSSVLTQTLKAPAPSANTRPHLPVSFRAGRQRWWTADRKRGGKYVFQQARNFCPDFRLE